jgi:hypothetical protein
MTFAIDQQKSAEVRFGCGSLVSTDASHLNAQITSLPPLIKQSSEFGHVGLKFLSFACEWCVL